MSNILVDLHITLSPTTDGALHMTIDITAFIF